MKLKTIFEAFLAGIHLIANLIQSAQGQLDLSWYE
jgi:hypothetical protein